MDSNYQVNNLIVLVLCFFESKHNSDSFLFYRSDYSEKIIPKHSCFTLISNSEQNISALTSRRLLTYEKVSEPDEDAVETVVDEITDFRTK